MVRAMDALANAFLQALLKTQHLSGDAMRTYQRDLLARLVRHARARVAFYGDGRLDPIFRADDRIDWDRWGEVPILTRADAQASAERLYAAEVPPECGSIIEGRTSGSTGRPLAFRLNSLMAAAGTALLERGLVWAGVPPAARFAWIRYDYAGLAPYPDGAAFQAEVRGATRIIHTLSVATAVEDQGRWLARIRPEIVMGYPNALALVGQALPAERDGHAFRLVVCNGEAASDHVRAVIERAFGCPTLNLYSASEIGTIAVEDSVSRRLYVAEEAALVEAGAAAAPDEPLRELIVTPFYNYAMPLIRYAPGDFVSFDAMPAPDVRTLRRLARVAGRDRNAFILPSGRRWWPTYVVREAGLYLAFDQIQFAQVAAGRIEVRFVSHASDPVKDAEGLLAYLRGATPEPMEFALARVADIPRRPSGKFEDAVCEIERRDR
jgi:phenylacetate-CoA ligase